MHVERVMQKYLSANESTKWAAEETAAYSIIQDMTSSIMLLHESYLSYNISGKEGAMLGMFAELQKAQPSKYDFDKISSPVVLSISL